jgi:hypothetical protein
MEPLGGGCAKGMVVHKLPIVDAQLATPSEVFDSTCENVDKISAYSRVDNQVDFAYDSRTE